MENYSFVAETGEIPSGERKRVEINGERITIFNDKIIEMVLVVQMLDINMNILIQHHLLLLFKW